MALDEPWVGWDASGSVRGGIGYSDNLLLSARDARSSPLALWGGDIAIARLPLDANEFSLVFDGEDRRYFDPATGGTNLPSASKDQEFFTQMRWIHALGRNQALAVEANHAYIDSVLDASDLDQGPGAVRIAGHNLGLFPALRSTWGARWRTDVGVATSRQWLAAPLSGYWDWGPKASVTMTYSTNGSVELGGSWIERSYDDRNQADIAGFPLLGTTLETSDRRVDLVWRHRWDAAGRWSTTLRPFAAWREDNGSGYFDFTRQGVAAAVQYRRAPWRARLSGRWTRYEYPWQLVSPADPQSRWRDEFDLTMRVEYQWTKALRLFLDARHERSESNQTLEAYRANSVVTGVEWGF